MAWARAWWREDWPSWVRLVSAWLCSLAVWLGCLGPAFALEVPSLRGRLNDTAGVLLAEEQRRVEDRLLAYERVTGHQFAILLIGSLQGEVLEQYSLKVAEAWGLGRKDRDDGLLLLIAIADRRLRLEVGYGLEGELPDAASARIIREVLVPALQRGELSAGLQRAIEVVSAATGGGGEPLPPVRAPPPEDEPWPVFLLFALLLLFLGGGRGTRAIILSSALSGLGQGSGRHRQGGGGFSGGGGHFGGGGASGRW